MVNNIPEKVFDTMLNKSENMVDNKIKFKQNLINNKTPVAYIEAYLNILKSSDKRLEDLKEFIGEILINIYNLNNEDEISDIFKDEKEISNIRFREFSKYGVNKNEIIEIYYNILNIFSTHEEVLKLIIKYKGNKDMVKIENQKKEVIERLFFLFVNIKLSIPDEEFNSFITAIMKFLKTNHIHILREGFGLILYGTMKKVQKKEMGKEDFFKTIKIAVKKHFNVDFE